MPDTNFDSIGVTSGYLRDGAVKERMGLPTIATTGTQESTFITKFAGTLASVLFTAKDALAASDTNFITLQLTNKGQAGAGSVAMLVAGVPNTTQVTGGTALAAYGKRTLALNATPANLVVAAGDIISLTSVVTGTLANAVTAPSFLLTFTPS